MRGRLAELREAVPGVLVQEPQSDVVRGPAPALQRQQAREVAAAFGIPRVLPRFAGLPGSGLTVVVTRDLL